MADEQLNPSDAQQTELDPDSMFAQLHEWMRTQFPWWALSFTVHTLALAALLLLGRFAADTAAAHDEVAFAAIDPAPQVADNNQPVKPFPEEDPSNINPTPPPDAPAIDIAITTTPTAAANDRPGGDVEDHVATPGHIGKVDGRDDFDPIKAMPKGKGPGSFNGKDGFNPGGIGSYQPRRGHIGGTGGGVNWGDRPVAAALNWIVRHQSSDGSWSLQHYDHECKDKSCTGAAGQESLSAATGLSLLTLLAAGQTHIEGYYKQSVFRGMYWLLSHQKPDGDLSAGAEQQMYSHGIATIALCEEFGMSKDKMVGAAAQKAINFIMAAQNTQTGGWRYHPGEEGDTSVLGWQMMALKSAELAGLKVSPAALQGTKKWLASVSTAAAGGSGGGVGNGQFAYVPGAAPTPAMSSVGLLCSQYLHAGRQDAAIVGGVKYLLGNLPDAQAHNVYYWYYASQVMHNMNDRDWQTWRRTMRHLLVTTQSSEGCAMGSWDPDKPTRDAWGAAGGRLMITSLCCLTLEVDYRYLPLYRSDRPEAAP